VRRSSHIIEIIITWNEKINKYKDPVYTFKVRDKEIKMPTHGITFSFSNPKIALQYKAWGIFYAGVYRKMFLENIRSPLVYILSREREKILLVCLQVRRTRKNK
jgi:hypothetical protein